MAIIVERETTTATTAINHPHPPPNSFKHFLRSPRYATLFAILATLCATVSYTSFLLTGETPNQIISTFTATTLLTIHIKLLLHARTLRTHPMIRTRNPNSIVRAILLILKFKLSSFLMKSPHLHHKSDIGSLVSGLGFVLDMFFLHLTVQPGFNLGAVDTPMLLLMYAVANLISEGMISIAWFVVGLLIYALLLFVLTLIEDDDAQ